MKPMNHQQRDLFSYPIASDKKTHLVQKAEQLKKEKHPKQKRNQIHVPNLHFPVT